MNTYYNDDNLRGFTLIELLAVIVVLAIVMLIGLNAVLPRLEKARKEAFAIEANGAIKSAEQYFSMGILNGTISLNGGTGCVTVAQLIESGDSTLDSGYEGKVQVTRSAEGKFTYTVYLKHKNGNFCVNGGADTIESEDVGNCSSTTDATFAC